MRAVRALIHRLSGVMTALLLCLLLVSNAGRAAQAESFRVTFVNPGYTGEVFWDMVSRAMAAAAEDLDVELEILYAERNRFRMRDLALEAVQRENLPDYLILVNEEQFAASVVPEADRRGVKVAFLLNDVIERDREELGGPRGLYKNWLGAVIPDNSTAGERMLQLALDQHWQKTGDREGEVHVLGLAGDKSTPASINRNQGLVNGIDAYATVHLDRLLYAHWREDEAYKITKLYLDNVRPSQHFPDIVWAANDPIAFGAIRALEENGFKIGEDVLVSGLNWSKEGVEMVRDGRMVVTDGGHFLGGAWILVVLYDYHHGVDFAENNEDNTVHFAMSAVSADNVEQFMRLFPLDDFGEIDFAAFSRVRNKALKQYDFSLETLLRRQETTTGG